METKKPLLSVILSRFSRFMKAPLFIVIIFSLLGFQLPQSFLTISSRALSADAAENIIYLGSLGTAVTKSSGTSLVINTTAATSSGDDILVAYISDPNSSLVVSVADTAGNTYTQQVLVVNTGNLRTYLFMANNVNPMASGSSITITASPAVTARVAAAMLFSGLADEDILDVTSSATGSSTTPSSGSTATTTQTDELLIGVIGTEGPSGDTAGTWNNSFTAGPRAGTTDGTADTNLTVSMGYRIVSATGAYIASKDGITSRDWGAIIATIKAGPDPTQPQIKTSGTPLAEFDCVPGGTSAEQTYTVNGTNLTEDITITAPENFEISLSSGSGFTFSLNLTSSGGIVADTPIYVRFSMGSEGTSSGNIQHTSSGATTRNILVTGVSAPLNPVDFNILLGRPTDDSVTANIITDDDAEFKIEYGVESGVYTGTTPTYDATAGVPVEFVIDGLSANTRQYYHIVYRRTGITEWNQGAEHSFMTQRAPGEDFVFTIVSDSHFGQYGGQTADEVALYEVTIQNIIADNPDFHLDLGDTYAMDPSPLGTGMTDAEADAAYYIQRPYLAPLTQSVPFYQALGNHENEEGWNFDDVFTSPDQSLARVGMKYRKLYYPNPIPDDFYTGNTDPLDEAIGGDTNHEDYYAWEWGDALFVMIDPFHYSMTWPDDYGEGYGGEGQDGEVSGDRWDWTLGIQQYLWLKDTLENSTAKYKFVFSHHVTGGATPYGRGGQLAVPYFEWGGLNADGTWGFDTERPAAEGWTVPVHQLMVDNNVDIYFHGHDHIYAYEEVDGIAYVEVPKPDDAGYTWQPYGYGYNEDLYPDAISILPNSGYMRVCVSPDDVLMEYVRSYLPGDGTNKIVSHSFTAPLAEEEGTLGDVNDDGQANSTDALIILSGDAGMNISSFCPINCGDVNSDGLVNSTDALVILSFDASMSVPFPVEQLGCPASITPPSGCSP